jgi:hypothetical protein
LAGTHDDEEIVSSWPFADLGHAESWKQGETTMRKLKVALMLMLVAITAWAQKRQWDFAGTHPEQPAIKLFVERASIERSGRQARVWTLLQNGDGQSSIGQSELDCPTGQARSLAWTTYDGKMGSGKTIASSGKPGDWFYVSPGSLPDKLLQVACR